MPYSTAVVNHLDEMARAARPDVEIAVFGRKGLEDRLKPLDDLFVAADHHAVADLQTPDAAAGAGVDEVQALLLELLGAPNGIFVVGVAAVDDDIAFGQIRPQLLDGLIDGIARWNHQPDGPRRAQLFDEVRKRMSADGAFVDDPLNRLGAAVVTDHSVAAEHKPLGHVGAHAAETDHAQFHSRFSFR